MLPLEKALLLTTSEEIAVEIKERRELLPQMVGQLYPAIIKSEIMELRWRQDHLMFHNR